MKLPKKKTYATPQKLEAAVNRYFSSISWEEVVTRPEKLMEMDERLGREVPVLDKYGHAIFLDVPVTNKRGTPLTRICWARTPSLESMWLHLGITGEEWDAFCEREGFRDVCARAGVRVMAYDVERTDTPKVASGAKFRLQAKFGWKTEDRSGKDENGGQLLIREGGCDQ